MAPEARLETTVIFLRVKSDNARQALVTFTHNDRPVRFRILVTARVGASSSEIAIRQTNDARTRSVHLKGAPKPWYGDWRWWATIGGGAAVGVVAMSAGGGATKPAVTNPASFSNSLPFRWCLQADLQHPRRLPQ